jgi:hypothetical protein
MTDLELINIILRTFSWLHEDEKKKIKNFIIHDHEANRKIIKFLNENNENPKNFEVIRKLKIDDLLVVVFKYISNGSSTIYVTIYNNKEEIFLMEELKSIMEKKILPMSPV